MRRASILGLASAALVALAAGASADSVPAPAGAGPIRYRDVVFPTLMKTGAIVYGSAPDANGNPVTLTLDMYRPKGDTQTSRPAIVLVHGGSFVAGNSHNGAMVKMATAFAQRGYVAVSINYRLLGQKGEKCGVENPPSATCTRGGLAAQHDTQAAVRFLRRYAQTYGIDPNRIAVGGGSAGAATALAVAVNSGDVGDSGNPGYSSKVEAAISISGELPHSLAALYYDRSDSPILMFNGTADTVVPFAMAEQTVADLRSYGVKVVFEPLQGAGHVPFATEGDLMISQSVNFAYDELDLANAPGQPTAPPTAAISSPRSGSIFKTGQVVRTQFSCTEGNAGPGIASCTDSRGSSTPGGRLDTTRPGKYTYTVTAVSQDGRKGTARIRYTVRPQAPALSALRVQPKRFRPLGVGPALVARGGMEITYRDSAAGRTTFTIYRGRKRIGTFARRDQAGVQHVHFSGRLHGHRLPAGEYVVKLKASLSGHKSRTLSARFRIAS